MNNFKNDDSAKPVENRPFGAYSCPPSNQVVYDPQLKARQFFWEFESPEHKKYVTSPPPYYRLSIRVRQGPLLGESNDYVFKGILGMSDAEVAKLVEEGVIA